jgi:hypothetical protein
MNDMTPQLPQTVTKRSGLPSSKSTQRQLVRNVTAENYQEIGSAFVGLYGGAIVSLADGKSQGTEWTANPRQWGAWRAYLAARKIPIKFMDARGKEGKCWTVPAAWPHEFDGDATVQEDQEAANWFMRNYRPERLDLASAAKREATVAAMKARMPKPHQYPRYESAPEEPKTTFIDKDKLLQDYEKDMAEWLARNAKVVEDVP